MVREESKQLWDSVKILPDGRNFCKFCERKFTGGITRIRAHFSGRKGHGIQTCPKVPESIQFAAQGTGASNSGRETEIISTSAPKKKAKTFHPPKTAEACKKDKSETDKLLALFLDSINQPLDVPMIPLFGDLLISVAEVGPSYTLPTCSELQSQLIISNKDIKDYFAKIETYFTKTGCTLIISKVETKSKLECLNFFVCSPGGCMCLKTVRVSEQGITFQSFKSNVCDIIASLGPEHVVQVILDDSKDCMESCFTDFRGDNFFAKVGEEIHMKYPWIYLSRCANGELGEIWLRICSKVCWIRETIQWAKLIFKYLCRHSSSTLQLLSKQQHPRNKEYSCSENSTIAIEFFMLNSILEKEKEVQAFQIPMDLASHRGEGLSGDNDEATAVQKAIYSTEFWSNGKKVVQVLKPLFQVLELTYRYEPTSGYLKEALKRAEEAFKQLLDDEDWIEVLRARRSRVVQPIHEVAGFLNSAYTGGLNFFHDHDIERVLDKLLVSVPERDAFLEVQLRDALLEEVQLYLRKDSDLFNKSAMTTLETFHPWKWWDCWGDHYPILQKIARRLLSQTCSTSLCDHITFRQNRFVNESAINRIMMEKFRAFKEKNLEPIDLKLIRELPVYSQEHVQKFLDLGVSDNNINDEVAKLLTSKYRNFNSQSFPECNPEPEQCSSVNLGPVTTLPECNPEPEQRGRATNLDLGSASTQPECNPEPDQRGRVEKEVDPAFDVRAEASDKILHTYHRFLDEDLVDWNEIFKMDGFDSRFS